MRVLVVGGAGFIGSHLCDLLIGRGEGVVCVDNFLTGQRSNIAHLEGNPNFSLIQQDASYPLELEGSVDAILHLASPASPVQYLRYPVETLRAGSLATLNLLELAREQEAIFLLASTSEVYGDPKVHPQPEGYWGNVNPVGPRSVYDEAKRFSEAATMAFHRAHGVKTRIARIFNTYGPKMDGEDGRAIPNFISQALSGRPLTLYGDGSQTRSFCYVTDLTEGLLRLLEADLTDPVNLGNATETTLAELAGMILRLSESSSSISRKPLPQDDPKVRRPVLSTALKRLGWKPLVPLEEGLKETIAWFRKLPSA